MKKQVKIALCVSAAVIALVVLFNLLPSGIRTTATLCAGFAAGWRAKMWYDRMKG